MNNQLLMPEPEKVKQTVARSHRRRLEMEIVGLELEEAIAQLEYHTRQKRLLRLRRLLGGSATKPQPSEQNLKEVSS